jgi:predicted outer membrane repeat protein
MHRSTRARLAAGFAAAALAAGGALFTVGAGTAGADAVGDEASFRTAFENATEIDLTANIDLTCPGGQAERNISTAPLVLRGHGFTIRQTCAPTADESVLRINSESALTLDTVTITGGSVDHGGGGLHYDGNGALRIVNSTFTGNQSCGSAGGGGLIADAGASSVTIIGSTFVGNVSDHQGGAVRVSTPAPLTIVNSTITGNSSADLGGAVSTTEDASIVYSTIVANSLGGAPCFGPEAAAAGDADAHPDDAAGGDVGPQQIFSTNVAVDGELGIFGTVIALGQPSATPNCDSFSTTSSGYNFSDDDSCLQTTATGDRENAGNPGLSALGSNGGPTQTMVPSSTSPLLNFIPIPACSGGDGLAGFGVTNDQRGILRPQSTGCEVGAVEVVLEVVVDFAG